MITTDSKNILLADDSVFFRTKLSAILIEAGHMVRSAGDGLEVIAELKRSAERTDILILDLQMPDIDGNVSQSGGNGGADGSSRTDGSMSPSRTPRIGRPRPSPCSR